MADYNLTQDQIDELVNEAKIGANPNLYQRGDNGEYFRKSNLKNYDFLMEDPLQAEDHSMFVETVKSLSNGVTYGLRGGVNAVRMLHDANVAEHKAKDPAYIEQDISKSTRDFWKDVADSDMLTPFETKASGSGERFWLDLVQGAGQLASQIAVTAATGGAGGLTFMGASIAGNQYQDLRNEGVDVLTAANYSTLNAAIQAPLERIGVGKILSKIPAGSKLRGKAIKIFESALTEGSTEFIQQYPDEITNYLARNRNKSNEEILQEMPGKLGEFTREAAYAGLLGALLGGAGSSLHVAFERNVHQAGLEEVAERAERIRKSGADPAYAASVINANLQNETMQVDAETLYQYAQTQNIDDIAKSLGVTPDVITEAAEKGQDIDILRGNFEATVAQKPDFMEAVKDGVSFEDGGYNINNARLQREIAKEYQKIAANDEEFEAWKGTMTDQLLKAGANKSETLNAIALLETAARTLNPENPMQYMRDNPLEIKRVVSTSDGRYLQTKSANEKLLEDEKSFAKSIDDFLTTTNEHPIGNIPVMRTPLALKLAGARILPVEISNKTTQKILRGKHNYQITPNILKQVPRALTDPAAIFYSDTISGPDHIVVALNLQDQNGSNIIVPFSLNVTGKSYELNAISSVYSKDGGKEKPAPRNEWFVEQIQKGNLKYINKKKFNQLFGTDELLLAQSTQKLDELHSSLIIKDETDLVKLKEEMQGYYQTAFHGSPHKFEKFDLGSIGTGTGIQAHGWGLYFAFSENTAKRYRDRLKGSRDTYTGEGSLVEVEIPEKDVLLDEDKSIEKQPPKVREIIKAELERIGGSANSGKSFYKELMFEMKRRGAENPARAASEHLNKLGIKGIKYVGMVDGESYVIFDDQAIKIINSYNQKVNNDTKGEIGWDAEGRAIISLFEGSDPSTVIHEAMGHYLSENIMRYSKQPNASEQLKADRATLLKYADSTEDEWNLLDRPNNELTKEQFERKTAIHERWATGAEQYFMLGKAPSKDLRRIFANWKKWLLGIYKSISDFVAAHEYASPITPEVQEVFDRALASEEAIVERQKLDGYFAKLPTTITDNLSDASKAKLASAIENAHSKAVDTLTRESLANFTQERREAINAYREELTPIITEHVQGQELYRAEKQMTEMLGVADAASAARRFQELIGRAANPEEVLTDKEQEFMLLFSAVAEENNYSSGENFAKVILSSPTEAQAIKSAVEEEVHKKYPDLYDERQAAELATKEAFYNDESGLVLGIEQQIIEDAAAGILAKQRSTEAKMKLARARRQQAKNAAIEIIDSMPINEATRVQKFITAERRTAAKAAVAARDGDMETALTQKRLQALNHELVMESMRTRLAKGNAERALGKLRKAKRDSWFNEVHFSQAGALFARMGVKLKGYDPANKTMTLGQYVNTMNELLGNADIAEWLLDETVDISNPSALTRDQYFDVIDAFKNIRALARQEKGAGALETKQNFNEFKNEALMELQKLKAFKKLEAGQKAKDDLIDKGIAQALTSDSLYEDLDNGEQGFFYKHLFLPLKHASDRESVDIAYLTKKFEVASKAWKKAVGNVYARVGYPELGVDENGKPLELDRSNLVKMLVYTGTRTGFRRLCDTPPIGLENSPLWVKESESVSAEDARQATAENIMAFLSANMTIHDVAMAQEMINIAEYKWAEKAANEQQTKGFAPKKQEATPREMTLADGNAVVFRGGYFPLVRDSRSGSAPAGNMPFTETDAPRLKYGMHTNTGSMKERTEGAKYPLDITFDAGIREVNTSVHDLHFRQVIRDLNRVFSDQEIVGEMTRRIGKYKVKALREQVELTARPDGMYNPSAAEAFYGSLTDKLRTRTIAYMIGASFKINTQNLANITLYGNVVEGYGQKEALQDFLTHGIMLVTKSPAKARAMWKKVMELSAMMDERFKGTDFNARELTEHGKLTGAAKKIMEWSNMAMAFTDGLTAFPVWWGAYTRQLNSGKTQQEAVDYADSIIRKTLGSTRVGDVSSTVRTRGSLRIMFMFQTFFNTQFNQWYSEGKRQGRYWSKGEYQKMASSLTSFVCAKWITFTLLSMLLAGANPFGDDDDDGYNDFFSEMFSYPLTLGGPIGGVMNYGVRRMLDMSTFPYRISPVESSINTLSQTGETIGAVARGEKEIDELVEPAVNMALFTAAMPSQFSKWFFNAYDILYGDMEPRAEDLFRRRPKRERDE